MHRYFSALLIALLIALPAPADDAALAEIERQVQRLAANEDGLAESERLAAFVDLYYRYAMHEFPEMATMLGHPTGHDRWTDGSFAAMERREKDAVRALEVLSSFDRSALEGADRLDYDLLKNLLEQNVEGQRFPGELMPITQMGGVQQGPARMLAMMPGRTVEQYENIVSRLAGVPTLVEVALERLAKGLEKGVTPPRVTLRDVPEQVRNLITAEPLESGLLRAFTSFPESIPAAEQERLRDRAVEIYSREIKPAYEKLHAYLTETYLPNTRQSIGMTDLPDGEEWYAWNVRQMTTTDLTPREIHDLGLAEVRRIRTEMNEVIAQSGFEGTFQEFTELLRTDPRFYFDDPEELLRAYRDIAKRADAELPGLFRHLPRLPYAVVPVPSYAEKSQTTAYYEPGSLEMGRAGKFFANTYKLETRPKWEMEALTLHEAVPGHHLQIAIGQEIEDIPWFRRMSPYTAYVEGWGLYAESLGVEMGFYKDPYSKFGQLTYEIWRAIRLVVDTGMHSLGWSREQAIEYFKENTGKSEHDIVVEVDRYIVWPGQALAYKVGELKIKELRARAEKELGESFDLRVFHDVVLGDGALPLDVLTGRIDDWIQEVKQEALKVNVPPAIGRS